MGVADLPRTAGRFQTEQVADFTEIRNNPNFLRKYDNSGYIDIGNQLILLQKESENSYVGDIDTVNKWANILQLSDWFDWMDFEDIPANYLNTFV